MTPSYLTDKSNCLIATSNISLLSKCDSFSFGINHALWRNPGLSQYELQCLLSMALCFVEKRMQKNHQNKHEINHCDKFAQIFFYNDRLSSPPLDCVLFTNYFVFMLAASIFSPSVLRLRLFCCCWCYRWVYIFRLDRIFGFISLSGPDTSITSSYKTTKFDFFFQPSFFSLHLYMDTSSTRTFRKRNFEDYCIVIPNIRRQSNKPHTVHTDTQHRSPAYTNKMRLICREGESTTSHRTIYALCLRFAYTIFVRNRWTVTLYTGIQTNADRYPKNTRPDEFVHICGEISPMFEYSNAWCAWR